MASKTNFTNQNGNKYCRVTADLGYDSNGKRIQKQFYGKTKKEAEQKKIKYLMDHEKGLSDNKLYFSKTMKDWLFNTIKRGQIKASSFEKYEGLYRLYFENCPFAMKEIKKITPINIQKYYNDLFDNGIIYKDKHKEVTSNTIKNANKLLKQFFSYCADCDYIVNNPTSGKKISIPGANIPKSKNDEIQVFSQDEIKKIINIDEETNIKYIALISYATGMRRSEVLGLKESDIDYINNEIHINRAITTAFIFDDKGNKKKETYISDNKTYTSKRIIPLPKSLIPVIKKAIILRKSNQLKMGYKIKPEYEGLIFLSIEGNLINASNLDKSWIYFLKRCGIQHKKFHALRHTYATKQFENGIQPLVVSKLLGHSNIEITLNTYTHVLKKEKHKAIDMIDIAINGDK